MRNAVREPRGEIEKEREAGREKERERSLLAVQVGRRERGFLGLAIEETARDVISAVAIASVLDERTLRRGHGYGNALAKGYGTSSGIVPRNGTLEGTVIRESGRRHDTPSTPESTKQLTLWGSTVSSRKPRTYEVLLRERRGTKPRSREGISNG